MKHAKYYDHLRGARNSAEPKSWYRIRNEVVATSDVRSASIDLYDEIDPYWGVSAADFVRDLRALEVDEIQLHINSPGGSVYDGIAIMNALRQHDAKVITTVDGLAASSAGFIAVGASDELVMAEHSELMAHEAWAVMVGNAEDMQKMADDLGRISANIASIYANKAGGSVDEWRAVMDAETWYSADEAVAAGLADRVDKKSTKTATAPAAKAAFDLSIFNYAGRDAAPAPDLTPRNSARPHSPSAERQEVSPKGKDDDMSNLNEGLRKALGIDDADLSEEALIAKVEETVKERDEALEAATLPAAAKAPKAPAGTVTVDAEAFEELKVAAALGRQAHERQVREDVENTVDAAVRSGRITPAKRNAWVQRITADSSEAEVLAALEPTISVVGAELGHAGEPDIDATGTELAGVFAKITGRNASKEN